MTAQPYIGIDRRQPLTPRRYPTLSRRLVLFTLVGIALWCALVWLTSANTAPRSDQLVVTTRAIAAAFFVTAGGFRLARWRLTGEAHAAWSAAALIVMGVSLPAVSVVGPLLQRQGGALAALPAAQLLTLLPVMALTAVGLWSAPVRAGLQPMRLVAAVLLGAAVAVWALSNPTISGSVAMNKPAVWEAAECLSAMLWTSLAIATWNQARAADRVPRMWSAAAMLLMGVSDAVIAIAIVAPGPLLIIAPGLRVAAAAIAVTATGTELWEVFTQQGTRQLRLTGRVEQTQQLLDEVQRRERERLHDARSAVVGIMGASKLLAEPAVLAADPDRLYRLMTAELDRLNRMLEPDQAAEPIQDFDLAEAIEPVVLGQRLIGSVVRSSRLAVRVTGRPMATATAVANVLINAHKYAPGSAIRVTTVTSDETVSVVIDDDGPGIPAAERGRVLRRGMRGSTGAAAPGSGLGLYTAAESMADQSGTLRLAESPRGGARVILTLPAARSYSEAAGGSATQAQAC